MVKSSGQRVSHEPSRATHALAREGQFPEEDTHVTAHVSSVVGVLASSG